MYLPDGTLSRKDYDRICGPNQDTYESEREATSKYAKITSVILNCLRKTYEYGHPNR